MSRVEGPSRSAALPSASADTPGRAAHWVAIGSGIASACLFALSNVALRFATDADAFDIALIRSVVFTLALAPAALMRQETPAAACPMRTTVLYGLFTATTILTAASWFLGLHALPLATATSLFSLKVAFSVLGAGLLMGEHLNARRLVAVCSGLIGGAVLLDPGQPSFLGAMLVLCAAASSALSGIFYAQLVRMGSPARVLLISSACQLVVLAPFTAAESAALPAFTASMAILSAVLSIGVMYTLAWAYRGAEVGLIAALEYLRLPFAAALGFLFFAERPTPAFFVSSAIIIAGAVLASPASTRRSARRPLHVPRWRLK